ncbi:MAG TPA: flippase [Nitrospiraceae bacterium]|jgi:O-antigen/teichoic acid export membrane protein|nr:flippase [Nitrospiraceae bacterium]
MDILSRAKEFLFVNKGWRQIVIKNTFWTGLAEFVVRLLKLVLILLVVRYFGPTEYGKFAFAFSFAAMFGIIFDSGLVMVATREFAVDRANEQFLQDIMLMRFGLGLVGMAAIATGMVWVTDDPMVRSMMLVLGASLFLGELLSLVFAILRARQRMEYECLIRVAHAVILLALAGIVIWTAPSVQGVSLAYLGAVIMTLALVLVAVRERISQLRFQLRLDLWKRLMRVGFPLALAGGMGAVYMNIDSVMLGYWGQITETGWYNAAAKLNGIVLVPMSLLALVTFPAFTATSRDVDDSFRRRWDTWTTSMIGLGAFFACVILASADGIVELAFGEEYRPAGLALQILVITAVLIYIYMPAYQALIMFDQQTRLFQCLAAGALINVLLNIFLIPKFSLYGAAWATVVTHVIILLQVFWLAGKYTPIQPVSRSLLSAIIMAMVAGIVSYEAMVLSGTSVWLMIPLGSAIFLATFALLTKGWDTAIGKRLPSVIREA